MTLILRLISLICLVGIIYLCWGEENIAHRLFPSVPADMSLSPSKIRDELTLSGALMMLGVTIALSMLAFYFFKIKVLPHLAAKMTNLLTGQDDVYDADDDELHQILQAIEASANPKDLRSLDELCHRQGKRLRNWTEYAHLLRTRCLDSKAAIAVMQRAIEAVPSDEDKALLLYRIAGIYEQDLHDEEAALRCYEQAAERYPHCSYGKMSKKHG